ncbi:MAG TPA: DUF2059 domain-containing protein [Phenylobacterium sp.]|nr:DUF2059 domain-containing protein [Phenylobacterium sp.]
MFPKSCAAWCLSLVLVAGTAWADPAPAASARQLQLAHRYILAIHMDRTFQATMDALTPMLLAQTPTAANLTPDQKKVMLDVAREVTSDMLDKVIKRMEPIMAETFTETELQGLITFYEGPIGQSLLAKQPQMAARMQPVMQEMMPEMRIQMMAKLCARLDCTNAQKRLEAKPS